MTLVPTLDFRVFLDRTLNILTPLQFGAQTENDGSDNDHEAVMDMIDYAKARGNRGQAFFFPRMFYVDGEIPALEECGYFGANHRFSGLFLNAGSNKNLFVSERWLESNQNLGSSVLIRDMALDANKAGNTSGSAFVLMNFRAAVSDMTLLNSADDNLLMPATYKDGTPFDQNSVGSVFKNLRSEGCNGHHVNITGGEDGEDTTYTDNWFDVFSAGGGGQSAMKVEAASGIHVTNAHVSGTDGAIAFDFGGASVLFADKIQVEDWGLASDTFRTGIRVAKVKPGRGVRINQVGLRFGDALTDVNAPFTCVSLTGGAQPDQYAKVSDVHLYDTTSHANVRALGVSCSSGGTLIMDYDWMHVPTADTPVSQSGAGTKVLHSGGNNSWDRL